MSSRVLVVGKHGQVASEIRRLRPDFDFLPKESLGNLESEIARLHPEFVINCAAYTAVDKAETDREAALKVNGDLPRRLAQASRAHHFHLVHFSTDYVFDGTSQRPYSERDEVSPINFYGESKLAGERAVQAEAESATLIRTSWVYSEFGNNFPKTMMRLAKQRPMLSVVNDQLGCPTWAGDLAKLVIDRFLERTGSVDLFHFSGAGETTWYDFAKAVFEMRDVQCELKPITTLEFPTPARRPLYSVMSKEKLETRFEFRVPNWKTSLAECFRNWELT